MSAFARNVNLECEISGDDVRAIEWGAREFATFDRAAAVLRRHMQTLGDDEHRKQQAAAWNLIIQTIGSLGRFRLGFADDGCEADEAWEDCLQEAPSLRELYERSGFHIVYDENGPERDLLSADELVRAGL